MLRLTAVVAGLIAVSLQPPVTIAPPALELTPAQRRNVEQLEREYRDRLGGLLTDAQKTRLGDLKPTPAGLTHLGGRWYLKDKVYYFRDAEKFVDLFSNQLGDSNGDGIPDLQIGHDAVSLIITSQNLPNHPHATFPNSQNPNRISAQNHVWRLPLVPRQAETITRAPMGPVGVAINGVVFFNPFEMGGINAIEGYSALWFDSCCGHPQQSGVYHYHKYPSCLKTPFTDDGKQHSPVIAFAWDGYPVYGPYDGSGVLAKDRTGQDALDVCNGHFDPERGYHYHVTPGKFPYLIGGYAGVVSVRGRSASGAIVDNTEGESRLGREIASLTPGTAARGQTHALRIELSASAPAGVPERVVIGPCEATKIGRDGLVVTCEMALPRDANPGVLFDCHLEFPGGRRGATVIGKREVFRVGE